MEQTEMSPLLQIPVSHLSLSFLMILLLIVFTLINIISYKKRKALNLPPSPPHKLPIFGHLHMLGIHPHKNLQSISKNYGLDLMLIHLGQAPTLVVSSPTFAREIMKTYDFACSSRPLSDFARRFSYDYKDLAFSPYSEYWREMRKICILQLLTAKRVQSFRHVKEEETAIMIDKIIGSLMGHRVVNLTDILVQYTSDIICRITFGKKYSGEEVGRKFGGMLVDFVHLMGVFNVGDFIPWLAWVNNFNGLNAKVEKTFKALDDFFEEVLKEHYSKEKANDENEDLVDVLLGIKKDDSNDLSLSNDHIKAVIMNMFAGGTDTTQVTIEWAMSELIKDPKVMKEVQQEVREIGKGKTNIIEEDLHKMNYLKLVIKETLRIHPPSPLLIPRVSTEDIKVHGYDIPAKTRVIVNAWAIGRNPDSWKNPERFEPKRFENSSIDYKGQNFEFIPFGAGRRSCPGSLFATSTVELGLANLLYRYDWGMPNGASVDDLDMTEMGPAIVHHRKSPLFLVATDHFRI